MRILSLYVIGCLSFFLFFYLAGIFSSPLYAISQIDFYKASPRDIQEQNWKGFECEKENGGSACVFNGPATMSNLSQGFASIGCLAGMPCVPIEKCNQTPVPEICKEANAMTTVAGLIGTVYANPPASGLAWTRDTLARAGILATPAYAQGIGFSALVPFLPLWTATRNIAYTIIIVIMIVIGFMIMFRSHIDPQTVISVQAALPKIVLTLLLITFSYAIVGFMVDIMYVSIAIIVSLIIGSAPHMTASGLTMAEWQTRMMSGGMGELFSSVYGPAWHTADDFAGTWLPSILGGAAGWIGSAAFAGAFGILIWPALIAALPALLLVLVGTFALLFTFIKLLMILVNAYIQLIISLILGPILLLNEAIPGRSGFKDWMLNLMANLIVFPATAGVLCFAAYLASANIAGTWAPPFLGMWNLPNGGNAVNFTGFLGLAVIFVAPNLVNASKKMFEAKPSLPIGAGTIFAPITNTVSMGLQQAQGLAFLKQGLGPILNKIGGGQGS